MGNELFYLDENGKKQDKLLHEDLLLAEDDPVYRMAQTASLLRDFRATGNKFLFNITRENYIASLKYHGLEAEADLTPME